MKLTLSILQVLFYATYLASALTTEPSSLHRIQRNPLDSAIGHRFGSHHVNLRRTTQSSLAISPESAEYQESIKGNFTAVVTTKRSLNTINITSVLTPINILQACTASLCVVGRLPVFNGVMSFMVGRGLVLVGIATMGLAWNETRSTIDEVNSNATLTTTGLYSQIRHPFLAGQWMALIGLAGCFKKHSPIRYLLAGLYYFVLRKKVELQEEELEQQFGHDYQVYKVLVKGQLIPYGISSKFQTE